MSALTVNDFDYHLPEELIARYPLPNRTASRLLVVNRAERSIAHHQFADLSRFVEVGDMLVMNNSKVIPARLYAQKESGGKVELLIERVLADNHILAHIKANRALKVGQRIRLEDAAKTQCEVLSREEGLFELKLVSGAASIWQVMTEVGHMPLPPYMKREDELSDQERYQTVYAKPEGSVAAPTAGLHFDRALLETLSQQGVGQAEVTLHVGAGTFQPVKVDNIENHVMHKEWLTVPESVCQQVEAVQCQKKKVIAVGTTTVRSLETAAQSGQLKPFAGDSQIFIYPGFKFHVVDAMITNFHLPKSTLMMLVSAFADRDLMMEAYQQAIEHRYRFFSYGDAMLIL